jgi:hypothetical protein
MSVVAFHVCKKIGESPLSVEVKSSGDSGYIASDYRRVDFSLSQLFDNGERSLSTVVNNIASGPQQPEELSQLIHQVAHSVAWSAARA